MSQLNARLYTSIDAITTEHWDSIGCCDNKYYTPEFLKAFETANSDIDFNYIVIFRGTVAVAFANTQIVTISIEAVTKNVKISNRFKSSINRLFCNNSIRVLFCGNVFLSGEYGTYLKDGEDKIKTFKAIADALKTLYKSTNKLNAVFVKDFKEDSLYITDHLKAFGYAAMQVEPNMIITLNPKWSSFEDYKNALKSKYRVKANKADSKSEQLTAKLFNANDIEKHKDQLQALYENMIANANFNAQILNLNTYTHLKSSYDKDFIIKGYFLGDQLVGFLSAMRNQDNLDAHFIGIDYTLNKEYAIYPRILNDYVRLGIEYSVSRINLGRTASEIKSTLGAKPEQLMCYIRHKRGVQNKMIQPFIKNIRIKSFKEHQPFKKS